METTWKELIENQFEYTKDTWDNVTTTLTSEELIYTFDDGYGSAEGPIFTAWSDNWVYFPIVYDGAEWVGIVPRNPCDIKSNHKGGE